MKFSTYSTAGCVSGDAAVNSTEVAPAACASSMASSTAYVYWDVAGSVPGIASGPPTVYSVWRTVQGAGRGWLLPSAKRMAAVVPGANSTVLARFPSASSTMEARATLQSEAAGGLTTTPVMSGWSRRTSSAAAQLR